MRTRRLMISFTLLLAVLAAGGLAHAQTPAYTFTKIHYPGAVWTEPSGVNDAGHVVGTYQDANGIPHGFVFDGVSYRPVRFPGAPWNYAFGISPSGQIVGSHSFLAGIGPYHAFLAENGSHQEFDYPDRETDGRAINELGHIVGIYNAGFGTPDHGFLKIGDTYTTIDFPGAMHTYLFGLNDAGIITGTYRDSLGRLRGFTYINGVYASMNFPGAGETYLGGINNLNVAVGWSNQGGSVHGFVWSAGRSFRSIAASFPGVTSTKPRAINDLGEIVGTYTAPDCQFGCGFIARPNPGGTPACNQTVALTYSNGALSQQGTLSTTGSTTWTDWLFVRGLPYRLWTGTLPTIAPSASYNIPLGPLPPSGDVVALSVLNSPSGRTLCADYAFASTGSTP